MVLWVVAIGLVIVPAGQVFRRVWAMAPKADPAEQAAAWGSGAMLAAGQTLLWCSLIGIIAAVLGLVWAWWMR